MTGSSNNGNGYLNITCSNCHLAMGTFERKVLVGGEYLCLGCSPELPPGTKFVFVETQVGVIARVAVLQ